jgi:hypothetical protein
MPENRTDICQYVLELILLPQIGCNESLTDQWYDYRRIPRGLACTRYTIRSTGCSLCLINENKYKINVIVLYVKLHHQLCYMLVFVWNPNNYTHTLI